MTPEKTVPLPLYPLTAESLTVLQIHAAFSWQSYLADVHSPGDIPSQLCLRLLRFSLCTVLQPTYSDCLTWFDKEPLKMDIIAFFEIPKSMSQKDRKKIEAGDLFSIY